MRVFCFTFFILLSACGQSAGVTLSESAISGKSSFEARCESCHSLDPVVIVAAPTLDSLIGRKAASKDFPYSEAFMSSDIVWTEETLGAFLRDPRGLVPDNQMAFFGIESAQEREDLVAYFVETSKAN